MSQPKVFVRLYAPGTHRRSHDWKPIDEELARELVVNGLAEIVNKGRDIRMFARTIIRLRDRSCSWSHRLMELVAEGNYTAKTMLDAIRPRVVAICEGASFYADEGRKAA